MRLALGSALGGSARPPPAPCPLLIGEPKSVPPPSAPAPVPSGESAAGHCRESVVSLLGLTRGWRGNARRVCERGKRGRRRALAAAVRAGVGTSFHLAAVHGVVVVDGHRVVRRLTTGYRQGHVSGGNGRGGRGDASGGRCRCCCRRHRRLARGRGRGAGRQDRRAGRQRGEERAAHPGSIAAVLLATAEVTAWLGVAAAGASVVWRDGVGAGSGAVADTASTLSRTTRAMSVRAGAALPPAPKPAAVAIEALDGGIEDGIGREEGTWSPAEAAWLRRLRMPTPAAAGASTSF